MVLVQFTDSDFILPFMLLLHTILHFGRAACPIKHKCFVSIMVTKLFPWAWDQVWESSVQLRRGQPEPEKQEQSSSERISCGLCTVLFKYRNHRICREAALFSLDVRVACTEPHITRADWSVSPHLIITVSCPRVYDTLELDDVLSSVCLYAFIIVSIWLWIGVLGNRLTWVKYFRYLDHKITSRIWIPFVFEVTENILFQQSSHTLKLLGSPPIEQRMNPLFVCK